MAFPTVETTNTSQETTATTSHVVDLPTGIASGDLIIVYFAMDIRAVAGSTVSWPSPWVELFDTIDSGGSDVLFSAAYLDAAGSETSVTVTSTKSDFSDHNSYRISGAEDPATSAPESADVGGSSVNPDPPSLNPAGWGTEDTLWLAGFCVDRPSASGPIISDPTNYTDVLNSESGDSSGAWCRSLRRELNAASEDPGQFQVTNSDQWVAAVIAVRPSGAAPPPPVVEVTFIHTLTRGL